MEWLFNCMKWEEKKVKKKKFIYNIVPGVQTMIYMCIFVSVYYICVYNVYSTNITISILQKLTF